MPLTAKRKRRETPAPVAANLLQVRIGHTEPRTPTRRKSTAVRAQSQRSPFNECNYGEADDSDNEVNTRRSSKKEKVKTKSIKEEAEQIIKSPRQIKLAHSTLVIGVDFGMTFSGLAFAIETAEPKSVTCEKRWPDCPDNRSKVPSVIAYKEQNPGCDDFGKVESLAGYEIILDKHNHHAFCKMAFDVATTTTHFDNPVLSALGSTSLCETSTGKVGMEAVRRFLKYLCDTLMTKLAKELGKNFLSTYKLRIVVTHPAAFTDGAIDQLRICARDAGWQRSTIGNEIKLCPEPEAACLAALVKIEAQRGSQDAIMSDTLLVVLDVGGLTCDASSFKVSKVEPQLKLDQVCAPQGGKCGTVALYCMLHAFMTVQWGDTFTSLPTSLTGHGSKFLSDFEMELRRFDETKLDKKRKLALAMHNDFRHPKYDHVNGHVILTGHDIQKMFDKNMRYIEKILQSQIETARFLAGREVETLVLCGGGSQFQYVCNELTSYCNHCYPSIDHIIQPNDPQSAIVEGAVIKGLKKRILGERRAKASYGISYSKPFVPDGRDDGAHTDSNGEQEVQGFAYWYIKQNDVINASKSKHYESFKASAMLKISSLDDTNATYELPIFSYSGGGESPEQIDHPGVKKTGTLVVKPCQMSDYSKRKLRNAKNAHDEARCDMVIAQLKNDDSGRIGFQVKVGNKSLGEHFLTYDAFERYDPNQDSPGN